MGMWNNFTSLFKRDKNKALNRDELSKLNIDIIADEKLRERLRAQMFLYKIFDEDYPPEYIAMFKELKSRLRMVNAAMKFISTPYGRAADNEAYSKMMSGWNELYSISELITQNVEETLLENTMEEAQPNEVLEQLRANYSPTEWKHLVELAKKGWNKSVNLQQVAELAVENPITSQTRGRSHAVLLAPWAKTAACPSWSGVS